MAEVFGNRFRLPCNPPPKEKIYNSNNFSHQYDIGRTDIIQAITLGSRERVIEFCKQVQEFSPVGAYLTPTAGVTPGYDDEVVFADGTFVDGSTLELSADGPLREPYVVYVQGCTHHQHWALILEKAIVNMGLIDKFVRYSS